MSITKRLTERVAAPFVGCRVDREAGQIHGVLICGTASANGRDYPVSVFKRDFAKYEGRPVNCDHGREATVERRFGWFSHVKPGTDGRPRGTLNCLRSHPMYERVMEAAERNPALFGFSHVAICRTRPGLGGREVVEAIESVESIDLVAEPATTKGLFEGTMDATLSSAGSASSADSTNPADGIKGAFLQACMHLVEQGLDGEMEPKEVLGKLKEMFASHAKVNGSETEPDEDADTDTDTAADQDQDYQNDGSESRRPRGKALREAMAACDAAGFRPDSIDLAIVAATAPAKRPATIERLKLAARGGRVMSTGRSRIDPGLTARPGTTKTTEGMPPADGKAFAEWIQ